MAGIKLAENLIQEGKNKGKVIAQGTTVTGDSYVIVKLHKDLGILHQIDYGSDISIDSNINLDDIVELIKMDDYSAIWVQVDSPEWKKLKEVN